MAMTGCTQGSLSAPAPQALWEASLDSLQRDYKATEGGAEELHNMKATNGCSMLGNIVLYLPVDGNQCSAAVFHECLHHRQES